MRAAAAAHTALNRREAASCELKLRHTRVTYERALTIAKRADSLRGAGREGASWAEAAEVADLLRARLALQVRERARMRRHLSLRLHQQHCDLRAVATAKRARERVSTRDVTLK